jgi:tetratricopeptide (TPR) repeat protein
MSAFQSSNIHGNYNIVVQARGDGIAVNVNQPHLSLVAWHRQQSKPEKILDLLNPFMRAIPLVGREPAKADLENWLTSNPLISVRCLIGGGGSGKTRVGIEVCESAEQRNWFAGFVTHRELARFAGQQNLSNWGWSKDTLVVVDYAAARVRVLRGWLVELAQNLPSTGNRLRLLLLERHASSELGWWRDLVTPGTWSEEPIRALFNPVIPVTLPSIATVDQRREILSCVMAESSRLLGKVPVLRPPDPGKNPDFDRRLADPPVPFAPLYLTMSGVTAVQEGIPTLLTRGRAEMARRIAADELSRIEKLANDRGVNSELLKYLAAGLTLAGGYSREGLLACIAEERSALGYGQQDDMRLADAACDALGVQLGRVPPILPDLIGEAAALEQLINLPERGQTQFVTRWFDRVHGPVAATLVRTAQDYVETDSPLRWFDALVEENQALDRMQEISDQLPEATLRFRDRSAKISELIVRRLREESSSDVVRLRLAAAVDTLASRLSALGRREEALEMSREALEIRQELPDAGTGAPRPDLAGSLYNMGAILLALGRRKEALAPAQKAADMYRELAVAHPDTFRTGLAMSLNSLAGTMSALGRREEALACAQEATQLYREVAAGQPDSRPYLAMSLTNLATMLKNLGRREEAFALAREATDLYRELAAALPEAFRPYLARSVDNLASSLSDLGRRWEALKMAQEAVEIYRDLAAAQPEAFRPDLGRSLCNLANRLSDLGQLALALAPAREALDIFRDLAAALPAAFRPDLALSLNNMAIMLRGLGRCDEALAMAQEAVDLYRGLAADHPDTHRPDLARSLSELAHCSWSLSMSDQSVRSDEEALQALGPIFLSTPALFTKMMAALASNYQQRLRLLNRPPSPDAADLLHRILAVLNSQAPLDPPA